MSFQCKENISQSDLLAMHNIMKNVKTKTPQVLIHKNSRHEHMAIDILKVFPETMSILIPV